MTSHPRIAVALVIPILIVATTAACSSSSSTSEAATSEAAQSSVAPSGASASSAPEQPPASEAAALGGPCDLLTVEQIEAATGVPVPEGEGTTDDVRKIQMCTWTNTDPFMIVAASLTDVGAAEAFQTNFDLAPAYFDGDPVEIEVPGTDKAYAVQQPDVGWVIGAIAKGRFLQIQLGGNDATQAQVSTMIQDAVNRLPA